MKLGNADTVRGPEAVKENLVDRHTDGPGTQRCALDRIVGQRVSHGLQAGAQTGHDLRPVAGERLRHVLVCAALPGAVGVEQRARLIGLDHGVGERLGPYRAGSHEHRSNKQRSQ